MAHYVITDAIVQHGSRHGHGFAPRVLDVDSALTSPLHNFWGRIQLRSLGTFLSQLSLQYTVTGSGDRFLEMHDLFWRMGCVPDRSKLAIYEFFGTHIVSISRFSQDIACSPSETGNKHVELPRINPTSPDPEETNLWRTLQKRFPETRCLFCCGKPYIRDLIAQSQDPSIKPKPASLYLINRDTKWIKLLISGREYNTREFQEEIREAQQFLKTCELKQNWA